MTTQPPHPDADDTEKRADAAPPGMPRWVKVFLIVMVLLALALLISALAGIQHGPGLHGG
jgi:hypothetical protein